MQTRETKLSFVSGIGRTPCIEFATADRLYEKHSSLLRFAQNALQLFCKKPRHMTHGLVLRLKLGKEIGEIVELVEYEVASLPAIRKFTEVRVKSTKKQPLVISNEIEEVAETIEGSST